ncbi:MAG TPA: transcriptional repressor [Caldilineae bacterium]|nr:transcriptional repressor [Caldilineae bacterium]
MDDLVQRVKTALTRMGGRMTHQRRVILEVLEESDTHMTAKDLYLRAHARDPRVTLSTVYRTLDLCKSLGLVHARRFSRSSGPEWYEPAVGEEHHHFVCIQCHRVIEFDAPEIAQIVQRLTEEHGITKAHASLSIYGVCAACSRRVR